ncbi:Cystathionine beta-lyase [Phytophthora megakarya]|uniref:cysteine-S-conjugate beta-lyase n=1 Tax=Phytophthora megakarya TaxID=4795 RepID=A0A225VBF8_9STRA|nr:Cystathionine beta-lyase [Phytophthora megakarya]
MASSSAALQQSLGESEVFDLVCDYLRTRQFFEAERTLRSEREATTSPKASSPVVANQQDATPAPDAATSSLASRLEFMLERSYVTQLVSGSGQTEPEKIFVPRHELETTPKRARANLDGNEALEIADVNRNALGEDDDEFNMSTRLVSFEACKDDPHGSATMPIYQTSTFAQPSGTTFGVYDYTRSGNPTRAALERQMAELEGGHRAFAFTSGMAALSAVSRLAHAGDEIVLSDDSYGGTYRLLSKVATKNGVVVKYVDLSGENGPKNLLAALSDKTKLVMMESPTNPMQRICDIKRLAEAAHTVNALLSVDNTMMSPILQNPIKLGADIVVHSATKFICGHSDTMSGIVIAKDPELCRDIYFYQNAEGTGLAPFDCWLLLRGVKTMSLRVLAAQKNAAKVANFLTDHPLITKVHYTNLLPESFPDRQIHESQARGCGSVVCFRTGSLAFSQHLLTVTKLFKITVSFGSVNSLISLPGAMSHASIPEEVRKARSFPEDLVRLSIGVEDAKDLIKDLSQALQSYVPPQETQ